MTQLYQELNRSHVGVRPARIELDLASGKSLPDDPDPVTWTASNTKLTLRQLKKFCDDQDRLSVSGGDLILSPGIWRVRFECRVSKTGGAVEAFRIALTSFSGAVPLLISDTVHIPAAGGAATTDMRIEATLDGAVFSTIEFRAASQTGSECTIEPEFVGFAERFANPEQARPV